MPRRPKNGAPKAPGRDRAAHDTVVPVTGKRGADERAAAAVRVAKIHSEPRR